jgi:hypothetical protein
MTSSPARSPAISDGVGSIGLGSPVRLPRRRCNLSYTKVADLGR